jgi:mono/diheme cytochrome c family protein
MRAALLNRTHFCTLLLSAACAAMLGCGHIPGRPGPGPEVVRPEEVLDFPTLYKQNCAACHGDNGRNGAAIALSNPAYIAVAGEAQIRDVVSKGVPNHLMPAFEKSSGGMLTTQQVTALAHGIVQEWGNASLFEGQTLPPYLATLPANVDNGQQAFGTFCAKCHRPNGEGHPAIGKIGKLGSIVDPSFLALISDQDLRSTIIAGKPDDHMPDWRTDSTQPMTDQQITDIVAWLASKRVANPGQPYPIHP